MPKKRRTPTVVIIEDPDVIDLNRLGFKSLTKYCLAIFRTPPPTPKKRAVTRVYQTLRASFRRVVEQRRRPPKFTISDDHPKRDVKKDRQLPTVAVADGGIIR